VYEPGEPIGYNPVIDFQTTNPDIYTQLESENLDIFSFVNETLKFEITFESGFIGRLQFDTTVKTKQNAVNTFNQMTENYLQTANTPSAPQIINIFNTSSSGLGYRAIEFVCKDIDNFVATVSNMDGVYSVDISSPSIPGYDNIGNDLENPIYKYNITLNSNTPEDIKTKFLALFGEYSEEELFVKDEYVFDLGEPTSSKTYEYNGVKYSEEKMEAFAQEVYSPYYDFLPKEWVIENYINVGIGFETMVLVYAVDGYTLNKSDFFGLNLIELAIFPDNHNISNDATLEFYSFEDAWNAIPVLKSNPNISYVDVGLSLPDGREMPKVEVTLETLSDIMTNEQIIEKSAEICETFGITEDELFELCGITQANTSEKTYFGYTEEQARELATCRFNPPSAAYFLPMEMIEMQIDKAKLGFTKDMFVYPVEGYVFTKSEFAELGISMENINKDEDKIEIKFATFSEFWEKYKLIGAMPNVSYVGYAISSLGIGGLTTVTKSNLSDHMTDEQIAEKSDIICETFGITEEELFKIYEINQTATTPKTYEYNGVEYTEAQMKFVVDTWFETYASFIPYEYIISEPEASSYISKTMFYPQLAIEIGDGYDGSAITADDFSGAEIVEFTAISKQNSYILILFNTFDEAYNYIPTAKSLPFVKYAWIEYDPPSIPDPRMSLGDLIKYSTPENLVEHADEICEVYEITEEYLFELSRINQENPPTEITLEPTLHGDVDNNGKVQLNDIVMLSKAISAVVVDSVLDPQGKANADVLADGKIDSADLSVFATAMVNSELSALPIIPNNE
jgi:hypothetical protein